jgi:hypothetical protein
MKNILLFLMFISYLIPIIYIYSHYSKDATQLSVIICKKECKSAIILAMIFMGIFTIYYESHRKDVQSLFWIIFIFLGVYLSIFIQFHGN